MIISNCQVTEYNWLIAIIYSVLFFPALSVLFRKREMLWKLLFSSQEELSHICCNTFAFINKQNSDKQIKNDYLVITCDLAEGIGGDYTVFSIHRMIDIESDKLECIGELASFRFICIFSRRDRRSRCGSVTLGEKQHTVLFFKTLVPLRYLGGPQRTINTFFTASRKQNQIFL